MVDAALIDIDGTLMDSNLLHVLAWRRAFQRLGRQVEANQILHLIGMGGDQLVPTVLGEDAPEELRERARSLYTEEYTEKGLSEHVEPFRGASDLLARLRERGVKVVLASSGEQRDIDRYVEELGGREALDGLVSSADVVATKPEPDIFAKALEQVGGGATAVVIGDTVFDVEAAGKLRLPCVCVLTGGIERDVLEDAGASAVYTDVADVLDHIDEVLAVRPGAGAVPIPVGTDD
ncbi:MAG: HAD family hydrolase [Chloroflexota bacterium]|nr:HAD family hydrolase [Chloroflexota bacterium]